MKGHSIWNAICYQVFLNDADVFLGHIDVFGIVSGSNDIDDQGI